MQNVSEKYRKILAGEHWFDTRVTIGDSGTLGDENGEEILFGGEAVLIGEGPEAGYAEDMLIDVQTKTAVFQNAPSVGNCVSAEISIEMKAPIDPFERRAKIIPYIRAANENEESEWIQKGVFFIDQRSLDKTAQGFRIISIHGYDAMMKAEEFYPENSSIEWPATDIDVVREIAEFIGVPIDPRTEDIMVRGYLVPRPDEYTCREVLGHIAAAYAGNFVMSDIGELRLIPLYGLPAKEDI